MADTKVFEEYEAALASAQEEIRRFGQVSAETADRLKKADKAQREYEQQVQAVTTALQGLGSAALATTAALYRGEQGAKVFGKTVADATSVIGDFMSIIGFIVPALKTFRFLLLGAGQVLKLFGKSVEVTTEQSDKLFESYEALSKSGAAAADGMVGIYSNLRDLGYGIEELEKFTNLIGNNSETLALMGRTVADGRKQFSSFAGAVQGSRIGHELRLMGMNINAINEGSMAYLKLQAQVGMAQKMTQDELAAGAAKYLVEMDGLAKATGIQRAELEKEIEKARSETRFRAKVEAMRASGDAKQIAAADELERYVAVMAKYAPQYAQGVRDQATGFVNTEAAQKAFVATQGQSLSITRQVTAGQLKAGDALDKNAAALKRNTTQFNMLAQAGGYEVMGDLPEQVNFVAAATKGFGKSVQDASRQQNQQVKEGDKRVKSQVELREGQRDLRDGFQDLIDMGIDPATEALNKLAGSAGYQAKSSKEAKANADKAVANIKKFSEELAKVEAEQISEAEIMAGAAGGYDPAASKESRAQALRDKIEQEQRSLGAARREQNRLERREKRDLQGGIQETQGQGPPGGVQTDLSFLKFGPGTGSLEHFNKLDPDIRSRFLAMAQEYTRLTGSNLQINSAYRSMEEQAAVNSGGNPKARPGMSKHNIGKALDLNSDQVRFLEQNGLLKQFGFKTIPNDPPHIEGAAMGAILSGPKSGYRPNIEMHGTEMIAPLDGNPIPVKVVEALGGVSAGNNSVMIDLLKQNNEKLATLATNLERFFSSDLSRAQLGKLDEISTAMRSSVDINTKILQAARQG